METEVAIKRKSREQDQLHEIRKKLRKEASLLPYDIRREWLDNWEDLCAQHHESPLAAPFMRCLIELKSEVTQRSSYLRMSRRIREDNERNGVHAPSPHLLGLD